MDAASPTSDALDIGLLDSTPVAADPFPHVVVPHFVPPAFLARVQTDLPVLASGGSYPPEALRLGPSATSLIRQMQGDEVRSSIASRFHLDLSEAPVMLTIRGRTREKDGRIHTDSAAKRVTVLLYLNSRTEAWAKQEGCLRLLRTADDIENYAVEVAPVDGTLLVFPNGPTTWHGHRKFVGPRHAIQMNYMANDSRAKSELRRHRWSAFTKRFVG